MEHSLVHSYFVVKFWLAPASAPSHLWCQPWQSPPHLPQDFFVAPWIWRSSVRKSNGISCCYWVAAKRARKPIESNLQPGRADRARVLCKPRRGRLSQSMRNWSCGRGGRFSTLSSSLESKSPITVFLQEVFVGFSIEVIASSSVVSQT